MEHVTIANWGFGVNSTAMILEMIRRGDRLDLIIGADTKGEKPETYFYIRLFREWMESQGRELVLVTRGEVQTRAKGRKRPVAPGTTYSSLEEDCLVNKGLPSIAYGWKTCSQKWKRYPIDDYCKTWQPAVDAWARGEKVCKLIGYDAGESHRASGFTDKQYFQRYPLIEWEWDRDDCIDAIRTAGLPIPPKSACFFCPSSKKDEIIQLKTKHPELYARAIRLEDNSAEYRTSVKGLGRDWSWRDVAGMPDGAGGVEMPCGCYDDGDAS